MTPQARLRRIGWFTALAIVTALYGALHFQVWSISSDVTKAERQIVALERNNMLLETEFLTRSRQIQLSAWNAVDFGYTAPAADQFIGDERDLSRFGSPRADNAPAPIRVASQMSEEEAPAFPKLVSPLTGRPIDVALVRPAAADGDGSGSGTQLAAQIVSHTVRIPLNARSSGPGAASAVMGAAGQ